MSRAPRMVVDRQAMIGQLLKMKQELGRTPKYIEFRYNENTASYYQVKKMFGNWNNFVRAAGLEPLMGDVKKPEVEIDQTSDEPILRLVREMARKMGRKPTMTEFISEHKNLTGFHALLDKFGNWNNVVNAALPTGRFTVRYNSPDRETLIKQVRMLALKLGKKPTFREFDEDPDTFHAALAYSRFGSWTALLEAAGLTDKHKTA